MKKRLTFITVLLAGFVYFIGLNGLNQDSASTSDAIQDTNVSTPSKGKDADKPVSPITNAFANHESNIQVSGQGVVTKLLPDDNSGSKHQKFIVKLPGGQTVLIAHNIDLAPRVYGLRAGDSIEFNGEYGWNEKGGVLHWTHKDPKGLHPAGWLKHGGHTYQ